MNTRKPSTFAGIIVATVVGLSATSAIAQMQVNVGGTVIIDNMAGDTNAAAGTIGFAVAVGASGWNANGTLTQSVGPVGAPTLSLIATVRRLPANPPAGAIAVPIAAQSIVFPAAGPPPNLVCGTSKLIGIFTDGNVAGNINVGMSSTAGAGNPIPALGPLTPPPPGPAGQTVTNGPITFANPVTQLTIAATVNLPGPADAGDRVAFLAQVSAPRYSSTRANFNLPSPYRLIESIVPVPAAGGQPALPSHSGPSVGPSAVPPLRFLHWDLREFPQCKIPYAINILGSADVGGELTHTDLAVNRWKDITPAIVDFTKQPLTATAVPMRDSENLIVWAGGGPAGGVNPAGLALFSAAPSGTIGITCIWLNMNGNRQIQESDIVLNDRDWQWSIAGVNLNTAVLSGNAAPFAGLPGTVLMVSIDGAAAVNIAFPVGFPNPATNIQVGLQIQAALGATGTVLVNPAGQVAIRSNRAYDGGHTVNVIAGAANTANVILNFPTGVQTLRQVDTQTIMVHEMGHFLGIHHSLTRTLPGPVMRSGAVAGQARVPNAEDTQALNFLYTPDLGDAPDPWNPFNPVFNEYQSLVHSSVPKPGRKLNGVQLFKPADGPYHIFGFRGPAPFQGDRFEWLGANMDDSELECESRQVDADLFDDGVVAPIPLRRGAINRFTVTITHSQQLGRYNVANPRQTLYFNGYLDFPGDCVFDPGELEIWWEGVPQVPAGGPNGCGAPAVACATDAASGNFVPPAVCTVNLPPGTGTVGTVTLNFDVFVPFDVAPIFYCRYRLDYGEDEGRVKDWEKDPLVPAERAVQFGEVEDDPCFAPIPDWHATLIDVPLDTVVDFSAGGLTIPGGFFGLGSDPVTAVVPMEGAPAIPSLGDSSVCLQRFRDFDLPFLGSEDTVATEVIALSLVSADPIVVTFNGGQDPESWDMSVGLSPTSTPAPGFVTSTRTHDNGGTFVGQASIQPLLTFTRVLDQAVLELDTGDVPVPEPLVFDKNGNFVDTVDPALGLGVNPDATWTSGIDGSSGIQTVVPVVATTDDFPPTVIHSIVPPRRPPPPDWHRTVLTDLAVPETFVDFSNTGSLPIPAGFFGTGSDAFEGQVPLQGESINPDQGEYSVCLQRDRNPDLSGGVDVGGCLHFVELSDSFGDGWNGANLNVLVNGNPVLTGITLDGINDDGSFASFPFTAATGDTISTVYFNGAFDNEVTYLIVDGSGNVIGSDGRNPTPGITATGACPGAIGAQDTVAVEIVALNLVSSDPITVTFNGGQDPEAWDLSVGLSQTSTPTAGSLTATRTNPNGGTFDADFNVTPLLTFERVLDGQTKTLDAGDNPVDQTLQFSLSGDFVDNADPSLGILVPPGATWIPGVQDDGVSQQIAPSVASSSEVQPTVVHTVEPPLPPVSGVCIPPGEDCWATLCDGNSQFDFNAQPIPANFFGIGSDPVFGVIAFGGAGDFPGDTRVQRLDQMCFPGPLPQTQTVPIEIVSLSLQSCSPITVTFNRGMNPTQFDVFVQLAPHAQPVGGMTVTKVDALGGTYTAVLPVDPVIVAGPPGGGGPPIGLAVPLPPGPFITSEPAPWLADNPGSLCNTIGFFAGYDFNPQTEMPCCPQTCHDGPSPGHQHCTVPPKCFLPPCPIPECIVDADCNDPNLCTDDSCEGEVCVHTPNFDATAFCCDPNTGNQTPIDDADQCTIDACDPITGNISHNPIPCADNSDCPTIAVCGPDNVCVCPDSCVPPGVDCWTTLCDGSTRVVFGSDAVAELPADFFYLGSDPFIGTVVFGGAVSDAIDTTVERIGEMCFFEPLPATAQVSIQLIQLSLTSCEPITVTGSNAPEQWNLAIELTGVQGIGTLTVTKEHDNGGIFSAILPVDSEFTGQRLDALTTAGPLAAPVTILTTVTPPSPWLHAGVTPVCGDPGFLPGFDIDPITELPCCKATCHAGPAPGHEHCTFPPACQLCSCLMNEDCDDHNECTADSCQSNDCVFAPIVVNDTNPCTVETCDPATGDISSVPGNEGGVCDDGNDCTFDDACQGGRCAGVDINGALCDPKGSPCPPPAACVENSCVCPVVGALESPLPFSAPPWGNSCVDDGDCQNTSVCVGDFVTEFLCYVKKNRALSTAANPSNAGQLTARRVSVVSSDLVACPTGSCVLGYFDVPFPAPGLDNRLVSQLSATPVFRDWGLDSGPVHFIDCVVQPERVYLIETTIDGVSFSLPLTLPTVDKFGDTTGLVLDGIVQPPQGVVNLVDAARIVKGFQALNTEPDTWLELVPAALPNLVISLVDASAAVRAFQGGTFQDEFGAPPTPCDCPLVASPSCSP